MPTKGIENAPATMNLSIWYSMEQKNNPELERAVQLLNECLVLNKINERTGVDALLTLAVTALHAAKIPFSTVEKEFLNVIKQAKAYWDEGKK